MCVCITACLCSTYKPNTPSHLRITPHLRSNRLDPCGDTWPQDKHPRAASIMGWKHKSHLLPVARALLHSIAPAVRQ